ncbi:MAG: sodium/proton-translocating pyrophosphatase, partial [Oligosphaeraceae bacterium]|nr:sodium/proton-translocating pyrophosphatase [Oligosphaeraceae bacterium]
MYGLIIVAVAGAFILAWLNFLNIKRQSPGTDSMRQIAGAIQDGADAFMRLQYKTIFYIAMIILLLLVVVVSWQAGLAFLLGACMSGAAGWIGMHTATLANVRVANRARETESLGQTLKLAFRGGSVMGLSVAAFALLGLGIIYWVFGKLMGQFSPEQMTLHNNWLGIPGIKDIPFTMTISGYALGCSIIAMFNRVGGGIYTKAADMGADLVGKTEAGIPEDDPRNPATIADNVGDNVGDVAGLGSDLLESYVGAIASALILAGCLFYTRSSGEHPISAEMLQSLLRFPLIFAGLGLLSCTVGIAYMMIKKLSDHPHQELNLITWIAAILTIGSTAVVSRISFPSEGLESMGFVLGSYSPWACAVTGIISGILIGKLAERYTSYDYKPTQGISEASREGSALTITQGLASG